MMWKSRPILTMFVALAATALAGCHTTGRYYDDVAARGEFCSPFTSGGGLTPWAEAAIEKGYGRRVNMNSTPYPASRQHGKKFTRPRRGVTQRDARDANDAVRMLGGWRHIADTSDEHFDEIDALALHLYQGHSDHDHYAEAVAATMAIYPELAARYHLVVTRH